MPRRLLDEDTAYDEWRQRLLDEAMEEAGEHQPEMAPTAGVQVEVPGQPDKIEGGLSSHFQGS